MNLGVQRVGLGVTGGELSTRAGGGAARCNGGEVATGLWASIVEHLSITKMRVS